MIIVEKSGPTFHLKSGGASYIIGVVDGNIIHAYWGKSLKTADLKQLITLGARPYAVSVPIDETLAEGFHKNWSSPTGSLSDQTQSETQGNYSPERLPLEYPVSGMGDLRDPALRVKLGDGSMTGSLSYNNYEIIKEPVKPTGLPYISGIEGDVETLKIELVDTITGLKVNLYYLPLPEISVILRWSQIFNGTKHSIEIDRAYSASIDLPRKEMEMVSLSGSWAKERHLHRRKVMPGIQIVESRGGASSHHHAPFTALCTQDTTEDHGSIWAASLLYSGNHRHSIEKDQYGSLRLQCGINPAGFTAPLDPGESFDTPAAVLCWSGEGLSGMTHGFHQFVRRFLLPEKWRDRNRPIIVNTWEAHYFDVNADNVLELAKLGKEIGGEVLVLDDGWFTNRSDDKRALGDWVPDVKKFPKGLTKTVNDVRETGMEFGIWVEPEMINPESELYKRHPEWILNAPGRTPMTTRNQLVLDMGNTEVVAYLQDVFSGIFSSMPITYVKWDMNRYMVETKDAGAAHRYMLGVYRLWDTMTKRFPHILFEGCAGGGGRFDFGSLAYMPQFWTSDQTDALERQRIQFGTSLLFPPETMGAHVSAVPNHQVGRVTPAVTRGITALCFNYGYELDLASETAEDKELYKQLSELYKKYRPLFRSGRFYRLLPSQQQMTSFQSDFDRPDAHAWMIVSPDQNDAMVFYLQAMARANDDGFWLPLTGLAEESNYRDIERDVIFEGALLNSRGLYVPPAIGDYRSAYWILEKEK